MKPVLACILLHLAGTSVLGAGVDEALQEEGTARREIFRLLQERRQAFYRADVAKFSEFETDDFTRITEDGTLVTKQQQLAYLKRQGDAWTAAGAVLTFSDQDLRLVIHGDMAVLTGRLTETETDKGGRPQTDQSRFTEVWVRRNGRWQTLHNHYTTIAQ